MWATLRQYDSAFGFGPSPLWPGSISEDPDNANPVVEPLATAPFRGGSAASSPAPSAADPSGPQLGSSPPTVSSDRATASTEIAGGDSLSSPAIAPGLEGRFLWRSRFSSLSTSSRPRPWMYCIT